MIATPVEADVAVAQPIRFWPTFVTPAVLLPLLWMLLQGLSGPDGVIMFYVISIGAIPLAFLIVLRPGWRLLRRMWRATRLMAVPVLLLMLPSAAVLLWGIYSAVWLGLLLITFDF